MGLLEFSGGKNFDVNPADFALYPAVGTVIQFLGGLLGSATNVVFLRAGNPRALDPVCTPNSPVNFEGCYPRSHIPSAAMAVLGY